METAASISTKFCTAEYTRRVWLVQIYAHNKSKMVDGRHFEKSINRNVLAPINTKFSTMMHNDPL